MNLCKTEGGSGIVTTTILKDYTSTKNRNNKNLAPFNHCIPSNQLKAAEWDILAFSTDFESDFLQVDTLSFLSFATTSKDLVCSQI